MSSSAGQIAMIAATGLLTVATFATSILSYRVSKRTRHLLSSDAGFSAHKAREHLIERGVCALLELAGAMLGSRHRHLLEAWKADLHGDPEHGETPSLTHRLRLVLGYVAAALRCRLDDMFAVAWCYADKLLASWRGSTAVLVIPTVAAGVSITVHEGFYGLVANAENLTCIATATYLALSLDPPLNCGNH